VNLAVIGCGKMGLPIAVQAASRGLNVIGIDIKASVVEAINKGKSFIDEPGIQKLLHETVMAGRLKATTNLEEAVSRSEAVIVIVPVLLTDSKEADLRAILDVSDRIASAMKSGTVVSFETTLPIGTTRNKIWPILKKNGLIVEKDFYLVFSPERVKSSTVMEQMRKVPKVVGGFGPKSLKKGMELYRSISRSEVISVGSLENAEMVKLAGMIYRDINIALANELARYCDAINIDLNHIIPFANTDGEANLLYPGIGVGGHCTPIYPYFLINDAKRKAVPQSLAEKAREINDSQADYVMSYLTRLLKTKRGLRILILGLGFRPDVKEDVASPAYLIKRFIDKNGGKSFLYDPLYTEEEITKKGFVYTDLKDMLSIDAAVLVTAHSRFSDINWRKLKDRGVKVFVDGRNFFNKNKIERTGIKYIGIGKGKGTA